MTSSSSIVVGRKPVRELLTERLAEVDTVYLNRDLSRTSLAELRWVCRDLGIITKLVPDQKLSRLSGGANHQGVVAVISEVPLHDLDSLLADVAADRDEVTDRNPVLIVPALISDAHNLGAIIRSAAAFGASGVLLPDRHSARISATTIKASAGAALKIPVGRVRDLADAMQNLKERGYWVVGLTGDGDTGVDEMDWLRPVAILVGNEEKGLSAKLKKLCDYLVSISIESSVESLNASVAAAIALHAASQARR